MYESLKGGGVSLVMQPLRAHQLACEAEEYLAMNKSTTGIDIVPLPTGHSPITESDALAIQKAVEMAESR